MFLVITAEDQVRYLTNGLSIILIALLLLVVVIGVTWFIKNTSWKWRKITFYGALGLFVVGYPVMQPLVHWLADIYYGVSNHQADALGNMNGAAVAADQIAGGTVPVGTVYTKLWIASMFFLLATVLPWLVQRATHPGPTEWAKTDYTNDFKELPVAEKFQSYGRLQLQLSLKIVGSIIGACLIQ